MPSRRLVRHQARSAWDFQRPLPKSKLIIRNGSGDAKNDSANHAAISTNEMGFPSYTQETLELGDPNPSFYNIVFVCARTLLLSATFSIGVGVGTFFVCTIIISRALFSKNAHSQLVSTNSERHANRSNKAGGSRTAVLALYGRSQAYKMQLPGAPDYLAPELMKQLSLFGAVDEKESDILFKSGQLITSMCSELSVFNYQITSRINHFLGNIVIGNITHEFRSGFIFEDQVAFLATLGGTGLVTPMHVRTCWMDEKVEWFVSKYEDNQANVVILGSGYDTRSYRMQCLQSDKVKVYEVDAQGTQNEKKSAMKKIEQTKKVKSNMGPKFVSCDFSSQSWLQCLNEKGFDQSLPTLVIWEGVTMYLSHLAIESTLETVSNNCGGASESATEGDGNCHESNANHWFIAFDYLEPKWASSKIWIFATRSAQEPFQSAFTPKGVEETLRNANLHVLENISEGKEMQRRFATLSMEGSDSEKSIGCVGEFGGFVFAGTDHVSIV